jgi:hypothetical protein
MMPSFWLTIKVGRKRIPIPILLVLPIILFVEILAIPFVAIYSIRKRDYLPLRFISGLYLSRLMVILLFYGRGFNVSVCDGDDKVRVAGIWMLSPKS